MRFNNVVFGPGVKNKIINSLPQSLKCVAKGMVLESGELRFEVPAYIIIPPFHELRADGQCYEIPESERCQRLDEAGDIAPYFVSNIFRFEDADAQYINIPSFDELHSANKHQELAAAGQFKDLSNFEG